MPGAQRGPQARFNLQFPMDGFGRPWAWDGSTVYEEAAACLQ